MRSVWMCVRIGVNTIFYFFLSWQISYDSTVSDSTEEDSDLVGSDITLYFISYWCYRTTSSILKNVIIVVFAAVERNYIYCGFFFLISSPGFECVCFTISWKWDNRTPGITIIHSCHNLKHNRHKLHAPSHCFMHFCCRALRKIHPLRQVVHEYTD